MANGGKHQLQIKGQAWQGPLPPPDALIRYNEAHPGAADRIIRMAEKEQGHRHFSEKLIIFCNYLVETFGLIFAFGLFAGVGYYGVQLIREGYQAAGISTVIGAVLGPLVTWLIQRKKQPN